jgi:hypothetical protein
VSLVALQIVAAGFRPKVDAKHRKKWNLIHWNWGRLTNLAGIVNVIIGAVLVHDLKEQSYLFWLLPVCICVLVLTAIAMVMEAFKRQYEKTLRYNPDTHELRSVRQGWATSKRHPKVRVNGGPDEAQLRDNYGGEQDIASAYESVYSDLSPRGDQGEKV